MSQPQPAPLDLDAIKRELDIPHGPEITTAEVRALVAEVERLRAELATSEAVAASNQNAARLLAADVKRLQAAIDAVLALPYATDEELEQMDPKAYQQTTGRDSAIASIRLLLGQPAT